VTPRIGNAAPASVARSEPDQGELEAPADRPRVLPDRVERQRGHVEHDGVRNHRRPLSIAVPQCAREHPVSRWTDDASWSALAPGPRAVEIQLVQRVTEDPPASSDRHGSRSGRWGSNPRPSAWEADALPTELRPRGEQCTGIGGIYSVADVPAHSDSHALARAPKENGSHVGAVFSSGSCEIQLWPLRST
jgi:hypothetical protein